MVIDIDGDRSFLMNCQELATIFIEKLDVKCFIMNNQHLGMVVQWEDRFYKKNRAHTYLGHRVRSVLGFFVSHSLGQPAPALMIACTYPTLRDV